ncbi:hypothetical protein [Leptothermofonsia sp. ETS-13]|uniref:hypothetical protein n=1 Tax=Leptothermofonsia sp. ETS-13 TaxID=3035696 RepID=UPI003BA0C877
MTIKLVQLTASLSGRAKALLSQGQLGHYCSVLVLMGIVSLGYSFTLLPSADASELSTIPTMAVTGIHFAQIAGTSSTQLPPAIANTLRQDLSKRTGVPVGKLGVVESTRKTWPNGCLGLPKSDEFCTQAMVEGWRLVLSDGRRRWVYRADSQGRTYRLESGDRSGVSPKF